MIRNRPRKATGILGTVALAVTLTAASGADPAAPGAATAVLPAPLHCGALEGVERLPGPALCVDMERVLAEGNLEAGTGSPDAVLQRQPAPGMCFVVAVFALAPDRTLSKYDYRLDAGGRAYECLGMAVSPEAPFDPRRWKAATAGEVRLLFEIPATEGTVDLVPALRTSIPMRAVRGLALPVPTVPGTGPEAPGTPADRAAPADSPAAPAAAAEPPAPAGGAAPKTDALGF